MDMQSEIIFGFSFVFSYSVKFGYSQEYNEILTTALRYILINKSKKFLLGITLVVPVPWLYAVNSS